MIRLTARLAKHADEDPFVVRIVRGGAPERIASVDDAWLIEENRPPPPGFGAYLTFDPEVWPEAWPLPDYLSYLADGDIIRINPRAGELWVMYRKQSPFNAMLLTERCNSNCIMCSQPPKAGDDSHLVDAFLRAIPLMSPDTPELCITGGEPTLLGDRLLQIIGGCRDHLPQTALHMLSNGRMFNYLSQCRAVAELRHPDLVIGIPLYSDIADRHDFVVQADGAFDQTLRGIMNLARCQQRVELRIVLHRQTVDRLPQFARFVTRNLPFVEHVAFMGLELMGYVRMNLDSLWVDPSDYQEGLLAAVEILRRHAMRVSIYNHQLCVLDPKLWPSARKSISDWKNEYADECGPCAGKDQCGGFFSSSSLRRPAGIRSLTQSDLENADSDMNQAYGHHIPLSFERSHRD